MWFARRPINSWDRNAFISDVKYGSPSYTAQMNHVDHNMIIANVRAAAEGSLRVFFQGLKQAAVPAQYGASQGFDTDDGSSWYDIHDNFMFQADGWKMVSAGSDRFGDALLSSTQHSAFVVVSWTGLRWARLVFPRQRCLPRPRRRPELRQRRHFPARPRRGLV